MNERQFDEKHFISPHAHLPGNLETTPANRFFVYILICCIQLSRNPATQCCATVDSPFQESASGPFFSFFFAEIFRI
jgi:hypothetical protein